MNNKVCDKYYIAQTRGEAKKLGLKEPHFCSLPKGHNGPHVCPGRSMHRPEADGIHKTPLYFELKAPPVSRGLRVEISRNVY